MKNQVLTGLLMAALTGTAFEADAQMKRLRGIRDEFSSENKMDLVLAKNDIDMVMENSETKDLCAAWGWKGVVYAQIALSGDSSIASYNPENSSALIAAEAFTRFFSCSPEEQAKVNADMAAPDGVVNTIFALWNMSINMSQTPGNFKMVKSYVGYIESLIPYDKKEKVKEYEISREKALNMLWACAYRDSLVDEEIQVLEKLAAIPTYLNADVFVRLADIYGNKKEYDKALSYLEKGKEKIPQKTGRFLEMQINIEIMRNNIVQLLKSYNELIAENPDNAQYYFYRGVAYHKLKEDELKNQEQLAKSGAKVPASKYSFKQAQTDYAKSLELDPNNMDALKNDAILSFDSANYIYKMRSKVAPAEYNKYNDLAVALYKETLDKFERLRQTGYLKDQELIDLLKDMKTICIKINDLDGKARYDAMMKSEKKKLEEKNNSGNR